MQQQQQQDHQQDQQQEHFVAETYLSNFLNDPLVTVSSLLQSSSSSLISASSSLTNDITVDDTVVDNNTNEQKNNSAVMHQHQHQQQEQQLKKQQQKQEAQYHYQGKKRIRCPKCNASCNCWSCPNCCILFINTATNNTITTTKTNATTIPVQLSNDDTDYNTDNMYKCNNNENVDDDLFSSIGENSNDDIKVQTKNVVTSVDSNSSSSNPNPQEEEQKEYDDDEDTCNNNSNKEMEYNVYINSLLTVLQPLLVHWYLPFNIIILCNDRKSTSTGIQLQTMYNAAIDVATHIHIEVQKQQKVDEQQQQQQQQQQYIGSDNNDNYYDTILSSLGGIVQLVDCSKKNEHTTIFHNTNQNTYVLFPSKDSIPISSIIQQQRQQQQQQHSQKSIPKNDTTNYNNATKQQQSHADDETTTTKTNTNTNNSTSIVPTSMITIIVIDSTWTNTMKLLRLVQHIPKIHLDTIVQPTTSYYWRWHNQPNYCVSTIEAIYYCCYSYCYYNMYSTTKKHLQAIDQQSTDTIELSSNITTQINNTNVITTNVIIQENYIVSLLGMMWLFAIQRKTIQYEYDIGNVRLFRHIDAPERSIPPYSIIAKQYSSNLRQQRSIIDTVPDTTTTTSGTTTVVTTADDNNVDYDNN